MFEVKTPYTPPGLSGDVKRQAQSHLNGNDGLCFFAKMFRWIMRVMAILLLLVIGFSQQGSEIYLEEQYGKLIGYIVIVFVFLGIGQLPIIAVRRSRKKLIKKYANYLSDEEKKIE